LKEEVLQVKPAKMLHEGIYKTYNERKNMALQQQGVLQLTGEVNVGEFEAKPDIAAVSGKDFLENHVLHEEVFGPYALMVKCKDAAELQQAWTAVRGQLTTSLVGTEKDFNDYKDFIDLAVEIAGRVIFNNVPTGVEVCPSMVHGGPFPASTDSRFTSVGTTSIRRWVRPVCFQGCPEHLLPTELKNSNPLNIWRLVNNAFSKEGI
jgi:NADP-dependent aldehyde dehydrogenase